jgi:hypothetical protein
MLVRRVATIDTDARTLNTPFHPKFAIMLCGNTWRRTFERKIRQSAELIIFNVKIKTSGSITVLPLRA